MSKNRSENRVTAPAVAQLVYERLRDDIIFGVIPAGTPLIQQDLADKLGVSRDPIKTALRLLEAEGFVEARPRRTSVVAPVSYKETWEVYEARASIEPYITSKVAGFETKQRKLIADELFSICAQAEGVTDGVTLAALDRQFHTIIYESAENQLLLRFIRGNWRDIELMMRRTSGTSWSEVSWREHRDIAASVLDGKAREVADLAEAHVLKAFEWIQKDARNNI